MVQDFDKYDDAMFAAVRSGDLEMVQQLAREGAPVNACYSWGYPVSIACIMGHIALIRKLTDMGCELDVISHKGNGPPLASISAGSIHLTEEANLAVLDLLLELGANPNVQTVGDCRTPLLIAIYHHKCDVAKKLLAGGADPLIPDRFSANAYDYAAYCDDKEIIDVLSKHAGEESLRRISEARQSTQLISEVKTGSIRRIRKLLQDGADISKVHLDGRDALYWAADRGDQRLVRELLEHGADPNNISNTKTALMAAASNGDTEIFDLLLNAGADIFASFEMAPGASADALHFAKSGRHKELAANIEQEMERQAE